MQLLAASLPEESQAEVFHELTLSLTGGDDLFHMLEIIETGSAIELMNYLAGDDLWTEDLLSYTEELYNDWHPAEEEEEEEPESLMVA